MGSTYVFSLRSFVIDGWPVSRAASFSVVIRDAFRGKVVQISVLSAVRPPL